MCPRLFLCWLLIFVQEFYIPAQANDCEVIRYETRCEVNNNILIKENTILIQINNRAGEWLTEFNMEYKNENELNIRVAEIQDIFGNKVRQLKKSEIKKSNLYTGYFHEDIMKKSFSLKHNMYPYRIYLNYRQKFKRFVALCNWNPIYNNYYEVPVQQATLTICIPDEYDIQISETDIEHSCETLQGKKTYIWNTNFNGFFEQEVFSPPLNNLVPHVTVIPEHFFYGVAGKQKTWEEYGNWEYNLNTGRNILPLSEQHKINSLLDGTTDTIEKIKKLYHYLQDNHRYLNVSIGIGGLQTQPATYVCINRYGDCKALSNFMVSMLKHAGIESYYTNVYANEKNNNMDTSISSTSHFNHIIVMVPLYRDTIWLECTDKRNPFGYVGTTIQNRYVLPVKEFNSALSKTPALTLNDVLETGSYKIRFINKNKASIVVELNMRGYKFEMFNMLKSNYNNDFQDKILREILHFTNYELGEWEIVYPHPDSSNIRFKAEVVLNNFQKIYDNSIIFNPLPLEIPNFERPDKRIFPVQINYPINRKNISEYELLNDYSINHNVNDTVISSKYGTYVLKIREHANIMRIEKTFQLYSGYYNLDEYEKLYGFLSKVYSMENKKIVLQSNR